MAPTSIKIRFTITSLLTLVVRASSQVDCAGEPNLVPASVRFGWVSICAMVRFYSIRRHRTESDSSVQLIRFAYRAGNVIQVNYACPAHCNESLWFQCVETVEIPLNRSVHRLDTSQYKPLRAFQALQSPFISQTWAKKLILTPLTPSYAHEVLPCSCGCFMRTRGDYESVLSQDDDSRKMA